MALGNDYELGTVRVFLSQGVERYQFILSRVLATVVLALANGLAYLCGGLLAAVVAHIALSDVPLGEAAGSSLLWSALKAAGVIGLTGFVFAGVVMLALVLGKNAWVGMLAGLGSFLADVFPGTLGITSTDASRYSVTTHAFSLLESCFRSNLGLRTSGVLAKHGLREPGQALVVLFLQGCGLTLAAILLFRCQDLMAKS
jgi:hypothetical protein